jgi:UDP-N-acetylmuramoyl-tripeptide--D-alanyl-D-alanine ligase
MELIAGELARVTRGAIVAGVHDAVATSLANDSRTLAPGACFAALRAARDGHDFVVDAFAHGATIALVDRHVTAVPPVGAAVVQVGDVLDTLAALGAWARDRLAPPIVVGITGSTGKTGTKELTASALRSRYRVHATPGNFNTEIGLPITLVGAPDDTDALVLEMGARAPGDIRALCAIARPTVGVVTNVGLAHAGVLGGPAGIAATKGDLLEALPLDGLAVLDAGDAAATALAARTRARVLTIATRAGIAADVRARDVLLDAELRPAFMLESPWGSGRVALAVRGEHQVANAALAATVALAHGIDFDAVAAGLASLESAAGRLEIAHVPSGALLLDDAYNANPASMEAALAALRAVAVPGKRIAVLGEMRELGEHSAAAHARIGCIAAEAGVDTLVVVGSEAAPIAETARARGLFDVVEAADAAAALDLVRDLAGAADAVLVKGSRAVGLDAVVRGLSEDDAP